MSKYKIPLAILEALEAYVKYEHPFFTKQAKDDGTLMFDYIDKKAEFYFNIREAKQNPADNAINVVIRPYYANKSEAVNKYITIDQLKEIFEKWVAKVTKYHQLSFGEEDIFTKAYEEQYFEEFQFVEDQTTDQPLEINQILIISSYLEQISLRLPQYVNHSNEAAIEEVQAEIKFLTESITTKTKRQVTKAITKLWAKLTKVGVPVVKEFLSEIRKEAIRQIIKGAIEHGPALIESFNKPLH